MIHSMQRALTASACVIAITLSASVRAEEEAAGVRTDLPAVGEEFTYAVDYTGVIGAYIKVKVGEGPANMPGSRVLTAYLATTPLIQNVWRIRDKVMTLYQPDKGRTVATRVWEDENGERMFREEKFTSQQVKVVEKRSAGERAFEVKAEQPLLDGFSAIFELRRRPLVDGTVEPARIYLNRKVYDCQARVSREVVEYRGEQVAAIRVDPVLTYKGESVKDVGFTFWLSDDEARIPMLLEADVRYGKLSGKLLPPGEKLGGQRADPERPVLAASGTDG